MNNSKGILAAAAGFDLPLQVLKSARGYYIGTMNHEGPVSRESEEYFKTFQQAEKALVSGNWTQCRQAW
jgi:predicted PolB exonuclease-like 3'-5' exonuclease